MSQRLLLLALVLAACGPADVATNPAEAPVSADTSPQVIIITKPQPDIVFQLMALDGVTVTEVESQQPGTRAFNMTMVQPVDHNDPSGATFTQVVQVLHRTVTAPTVLSTSGYMNWGPQAFDNEPSAILNANVIEVEQRFFGASLPNPLQWEALDIAQAAADHHRIVEAFRTIYKGKWISTGASKGGMTSIYHRRFHPQDVDATVAYVAPHSYGTNDLRYVAFLEMVGEQVCRDRVVAFQRALLSRRGELLGVLAPVFEAHHLTFDIAGSLEIAFEYAVEDARFAFWQYGQLTCADLPSADAPAPAMLNALGKIMMGMFNSDQELAAFQTYYQQAATQLGQYGPLELHLEDLLLHPGTYRVEALAPAPTAFDVAAMPDIQAWLATSGERIMFIYGENDPWSAGAFALGRAKDSYLYWAKGKNHLALIHDLEDSAAAMAKLQEWAGVSSARDAAPFSASEEQLAEWRAARLHRTQSAPTVR